MEARVSQTRSRARVDSRSPEEVYSEEVVRVPEGAASSVEALGSLQALSPSAPLEEAEHRSLGQRWAAAPVSQTKRSLSRSHQGRATRQLQDRIPRASRIHQVSTPQKNRSHRQPQQLEVLAAIWARSTLQAMQASRRSRAMADQLKTRRHFQKKRSKKVNYDNRKLS
jgi:hypothetical protein